MDHKQLIQSYREEVSTLRAKLSELDVTSVEQRASDEVRKWRQTFDTSAAVQMEQTLNEMEKRKQAEINSLANELRASLYEFKESNLNRLAEVEAFITKMNLDDDVQLDYVKFELDSVIKQIDSLDFNILVEIVDQSKRRRSSTVLARNALELSKVFELKSSQPNNKSGPNFLDPLKNVVRRASTAGASYYNVGILGKETYF